MSEHRKDPINIKDIIESSFISLNNFKSEELFEVIAAKPDHNIVISPDGSVEYRRTEGIYSDLSNHDYHADKKTLSRSALMDFDRSPNLYWAKHLNPLRPIKDSTKEMRLGSAFHKLMLEADSFQHEFIVAPQAVLLKDVGREAYDEYKEELEKCANSLKTLINWDDFVILQQMREVFRSNSVAMDLISNGKVENSLFWKDEHSGLMLKARPDVWHDNMIVDLKTCSDASPRAYQNEMVKYGYHIQAAMIRDGIEKLTGNRINKFINVCIETKYPYTMAIYIIDEFALEVGHLKYKQLCFDLKKCLETNEFRDYGIQEIGLPKWAT